MIPSGAVPFQCSVSITNSATAVQLADSLTAADLAATAKRTYYVTQCTATSRDAAADTNVDLLSDTTRIWRQAVAQAGGGFSANGTQALCWTAEGGALKAKLADAIAGAVHLNVAGYWLP